VAKVITSWTASFSDSLPARSATRPDMQPRVNSLWTVQAGIGSRAGHIGLKCAKNALEVVLERALGRVGGRKPMLVADPWR